jgi:hypothetical protein
MTAIHNEAHPLAGKTVKIKPGATHLQVPDFGGSEYRVEDWWDRVGEQSWMSARGNPACIIYALRAADNKLPTDDDVLYGKIGALGHIVHVSEIENSGVSKEPS